MRQLSLALLVVIGSAVFWTNQVDAVCCSSPCGGQCAIYSGYCDDCTRTTPYCGLGKCNIFGCNCDGGCRKGVGCWNCNCPIVAFALDHTHEAVEPISESEYLARSEAHIESVMKQADQTKDGRISRDEYQQWVEEYYPSEKKERSLNFDVEFQKMDLDRSGYLTKQEIDPR